VGESDFESMSPLSEAGANPDPEPVDDPEALLIQFSSTPISHCSRSGLVGYGRFIAHTRCRPSLARH
jgi:hypothetical protein